MIQLSAIVLAAGKGTRMNSPLPKVLHPVAGEPMINRVINALISLGTEDIQVVVGYGESLLRQLLEPQGVTCHKQKEQKGTADAVKSADIGSLKDHVLIVNGDHPLLSGKRLRQAHEHFVRSKSQLMVLTSIMDEPGNLGRIVRHQGSLKAIVEVRDASSETKKIREVNTGIYFVTKTLLEESLPKIQPGNQQGEYYLTDLVSLCLEKGHKVEGFETDPPMAFGVNSQKQLALAGKALFREKAFSLMEQGVVIIDPENTYVEEAVKVGSGSVLYPGSWLKGKTVLKSFCVVEPHVFIQDSILGQSVQVRAGSYLERAKVGNEAVLGPYARLRSETEIGHQAHIGNFVELKKVKFGDRSKANHLTYLGDTEVGENSNIGCGVITCNYAADRKKHKTKIGDNVFVGSDTQLVAPVEVGNNAIIASGSTINKNIPEEALAIARSKQINKEGYAPKLRGKK